VATKPVHIGCAGWVYPHWRERLYPKGLPQRRWLSHYAEHYDAVEVNSTFYRLASPAAVQGWIDQSPPGFMFAVKASRYLTHVKRLKTLDPYVKRFYEPLEPLAAAEKLGPVLWQLPESFHRNDERLEGALSALPEGRHAFEFRHASWFADDTYEALRQGEAALCIADSEKLATPLVATTNWGYLRLRREDYVESDIRQWAKRISAQNWERSFVYFKHEDGAKGTRYGALLQSLM
jgi:uncharacterized protein YecE (DUF72 family)